MTEYARKSYRFYLGQLNKNLQAENLKPIPEADFVALDAYLNQPNRVLAALLRGSPSMELQALKEMRIRIEYYESLIEELWPDAKAGFEAQKARTRNAKAAAHQSVQIRRERQASQQADIAKRWHALEERKVPKRVRTKQIFLDLQNENGNAAPSLRTIQAFTQKIKLQ